MSGIGAIVWHDGRGEADREQAARFAQALRVYGRDRQDSCFSGPCVLLYAHCGPTTIHDPDAAPAEAGDGRYQLVFDGRLDRREELLQQLGAGREARGWSDARLAAECWAKWRQDAPRHWSGEFAVIVWDALERELHCVRDQLGQRPLSWHRREDGAVVVATAPKPMFAVDGVPREADEQKIADQLVQLFNDSERSFYRGIQRFSAAQVVTLTASDMRKKVYWSLGDVVLRKRPYDIAQLAEEGLDLFDKATAECLRGSRRPGAFMSGGLDSSSVAVSALQALPPTQSLPTFTSLPSSDWDGRCPSGTYGDEKPFVEAIARMHPRLKPQYVRSEGLGMFHLLEEFIDLAGVAPRNTMNFCWLHEIRQTARDQGLDLLLEGGMGNAALSWGGEGAWLEWLRQGLLGPLARDIARVALRPRSLAWRVFNQMLVPSLPKRAALWVRNARSGFPNWPLWYNYSAINPAFFNELNMQRRLDEFGWDFYVTGDVGRDQRRRLLSEGPAEERGEISLGFRALHRIDVRDPFCDLKLLEWCFSLPDEVFYAGNRHRGLIKRMMQDRLPPEVLGNRGVGRQVIDWHARMTWDIDRIRDEVTACVDDPDAARYIDVARLNALLDNWPDTAPLGRVRPDTTAAFASVAMASSLAAGRLVRRAKGSNR
jgi:asparagine synthase (glutamine-hydrolysing)